MDSRQLANLENLFSLKQLDDRFLWTLACSYATYHKTSAGYIISNEDTQIIRANRRAHEIFGYEYKDLELEKLKILHLVPENSRIHHRAGVLNEEKISKMLGHERLVTGKKKNGEDVSLEVRIERVNFPNQTLFLTSVYDQTLILKENDDLHLQRDHIANLLHNLSHDLRTPVNPIIGFAQMLEVNVLSLIETFGSQIQTAEGTFVDLNKHLDYLRDIQTGGNSLIIMLTDILEASNLKDGKTILNIEKIRLNDIINRLYSTFGHFNENNKIELNFKIDTKLIDSPNSIIRSSRYALDRILDNLIGNAIKYNKLNGKINLDVSFKNRVYFFSVSDTGLGMSENEVKEIFDLFKQFKNYQESNLGGGGLGLTIAKCYAESLKGRINVESIKGKGSTFTFEHPKFDPNCKIISVPGLF